MDFTTHDEIEEQFHLPFVELGEQVFDVLHGTIRSVNITVVRYVVPHVNLFEMRQSVFQCSSRFRSLTCGDLKIGLNHITSTPRSLR